MTLRTTLLALAAATALLGFSAAGAFAGQASMDDDATMFSHPGWGDTGNSADEDDDVFVKACTSGFCLIKDDGDSGWVKKSAIDFGDSDDNDDDDDGDGIVIHLGGGHWGGGHWGGGHHHHHH